MKQNLLEMRTVTITEKGQIAIPKDVRALKGFKEGSKLVLVAFKDRIELRPAEWLEGMFGALASEETLKKDWLTKEEDEAWKHL
jgi:AbrB family looped-hinge helix DNA binding protein